ncbi:glycoside hydrolase [Candidatus Tisiphia endosymbiont of Nemotelus uliginosus]|uniref:glycoside hydrolase n=1 Tax=Candidatus Tisiphia endosymbiont of Nemotelus uliginosus TaxID=3077926 RepID=UPI0035C8899E
MMIIKKLIIILSIIFSYSSALSFTCENGDNKIVFENDKWQGEVNASTLLVKARQITEKNLRIVADTPMYLGHITGLVCDKKNARWHYPKLGITIKLSQQENRLIFHIESNKEQALIFPRSGNTLESWAIIYPSSEGLFIPQQDKFWQKQLVGTTLQVNESMTMPFWAIYYGTDSIVYILHDDLNSELSFKLSLDNKIYVQLEHNFYKANKSKIPAFEFSITFGDKSPIAPALEYKKYLLSQEKIKTLHEKALVNKNIEKLYGALHIYLWGSGRTLAAINKLYTLGLKNLWLGYDQDERTGDNLITKELIEKAISLGYLIGPYDSFHTVENPVNARSINSIFPGHYPQSCIINKDGQVNIGFGGVGCHMSSAALVAQHPKNKTIYKRIDRFVNTGINSYFLDCDATGELFNDYSPLHPMTQAQDRINRSDRMQYISLNKKLVLGSETAAWWAVPYIAFAHGNLSVHNSIHWGFAKKRDLYGKYWPPARPEFFFKSINAPAPYIKARYNPKYRIPLFQAVFHQAIITTDRWEIPHMKFANAVQNRALLELLYGVPSIWSLDLLDINKYSNKLKKLYQFFSPIHKVIVSEELTEFRWLDDNRQVQQTVFGNKIKLTANFSDKMYHSIKPNTIKALWLESNLEQEYTP